MWSWLVHGRRRCLMTNTSVQDLRELLKRLEQRRERLKRDLQQVENDFVSTERIIQLLSQPDQKAEEIWPESYLREFDGLTQIQALVKIARTNGRNKLNVQEAKNLMLKTGLISSPKNASSILYSAIIRSERFRKIGKGEYELIANEKPKGASLIPVVAAS